MKQLRPGGAALLAIFWLATAAAARAQTSLDVLEKDLDQVKQEHQEASSENFTNFLAALDAAVQSPDAAMQLYQKAGGDFPDLTAVKTKYEHETPDEKAARLAKDQANLNNFGGMLQLHCGLMRCAALFVEKPDAPTLKDDWIAWLKNAAQNYPQLTGVNNIRDLTMQDSPIGTYLGFRGWGEKDQGKWSVHDVPRFYREQVLEPLRQPPVAAALPAWDTYIAMRNADEPDADKWNDDTYPALQFDRASDDFAIAPDTDKLQTLVGIIKAHPNHAKIDDWIARVHAMMKSYREQTGGGAGTTTNASAPDASTPASNAAPAAP